MSQNPQARRIIAWQGGTEVPFQPVVDFPGKMQVFGLDPELWRAVIRP